MAIIKQNKGFTFSIDTERNIIKICLWGIWDRKLIEQYTREYQKQAGMVKDNGQEWNLLMDLTGYSHQAPEIQRMLCKELARLKKYTIKREAILVRGPIVRFPIECVSQKPETLFFSYFQSESDAIRWLLNEAEGNNSPSPKGVHE